MLFADQANRDGVAGRIGNRRAEHGFGREASFCMVAQGPVPEIGKDHLRRINYVDSDWRVPLLQRLDSIRAR